jgi:hypothetical protein
MAPRALRWLKAEPDLGVAEPDPDHVDLLDAGPEPDAPGHLGGHLLQGVGRADDDGLGRLVRLELAELLPDDRPPR